MQTRTAALNLNELPDPTNPCEVCATHGAECVECRRDHLAPVNRAPAPYMIPEARTHSAAAHAARVAAARRLCEYAPKADWYTAER